MATKLWVGTDTGNEGEWATAANWSPSGVPQAADDVYLENSSQDVSADLDQSAIQLNSLNIAQSYTGKIGTTTAYLQIGADNLNIGYHYGTGTPSGSQRIKLNLGDAPCGILIQNSAKSSYETNMPPIRILCNDVATTLTVLKGIVGIAVGLPSETSVLASISTGYVTNVNTDASIMIGAGVTLTTLTMAGGAVLLGCAATTVTVSAGTLNTEGAGAITTLTVTGGTVNPKSSGTITTLNAHGGTVDLSTSVVARTVTTLNAKTGTKIKVNPSIVTLTNDINLEEAMTISTSV